MIDDCVTKLPRKMCDIRAEYGERNRAAFLEAIRAGTTIAEACRAAGWTDRSTYRQNRKRHPWWAAQVEYERSIARDRRNGIRRDSWMATRTLGNPDSKWPHLRTFNF